MTPRLFRLLPCGAVAVWLLAASPASAHHLMELVHQSRPTLLSGLLSGLGHPLLGPDHLLFLLALGLVGLKHSGRWMIALLGVALLGSALGLVWPGLPGAAALVALSLVALALVLLDRLPPLVLLPAIALHGYALSASVIGWESTPLAAYLVGLLLSQGVLLLVALRLVRRWSGQASLGQRRLLAGLLLGLGAAFTWTALVP